MDSGWWIEKASNLAVFCECDTLTELIELVALQQGDVASLESFASHSSGGTLFQIGLSPYGFPEVGRVWNNSSNVVFVPLLGTHTGADPLEFLPLRF